MNALRNIPGIESVPRRNGSFVYFLTDKGTVVYVGQTNNLFNRASSHKRKRFDTLHYFPVPKDQLGVVEDKYIRLFQPKYNIDQRIAPDTYRWVRVSTNVYRYEPSQMLYCRAKVRGSLVRLSLRTKDLNTARQLMPAVVRVAKANLLCARNPSASLIRSAISNDKAA